MPCYFVEYLDDFGNPASALVLAPNEEDARAAIGPLEIETVLELPRPDGPDSRALAWFDDPAFHFPAGVVEGAGPDEAV